MALQLFFCVLFLCFSISLSVELMSFEICGREPTPVSVFVTPCGQSTHGKKIGCIFTQGSQVKVEAAFIAPFDSNQLEIGSTVSFRGHEVPLPDSGNNACLHLAPGCPIKKGRVYIFTYRFDIMKYYPTGTMDVKIMIRDRTKRVAACAKMPVIIIESRKIY